MTLIRSTTTIITIKREHVQLKRATVLNVGIWVPIETISFQNIETLYWFLFYFILFLHLNKNMCALDSD